jgi:hypothetical protein
MLPYLGGLLRKYCFPLLAIVALIWAVSSCASNTDEVKARLGEEFSLRIGHTAAMVGENLRIRFDEVIEDSRCPKNVTCIWEGMVSCVVQLIEGDSSDAMVLTEHGMNDRQAKENYGEYQLAFHVEPYPEEAGKIPEHKYELLLIVSKRLKKQ